MKNKELFRSFPIFNLLVAGVILGGAIGCGGSGGGGSSTTGSTSATGALTGTTATTSTSSTGTTGTTGTTTTGGNANPYAGQYSGEFVDQNDFIGTFSFTIASNGGVDGSFGYATPINLSGSITNSGTGTITDSNGTFQITLGAPGETTLGGGIGTPGNGAFITLVSSSGTSGGNNYYSGTVKNTTRGATGIIAFTVTPSGTVSGADLFDVSGTPTLKGISGTLTSAGKLTYVVDGVTVTGQVSASSGAISGNLSESDGSSAVITVSRPTF